MQQPYQGSYCVYREGEATQALDPVGDRLVSTGSHHLSLDALHWPWKQLKVQVGCLKIVTRIGACTLFGEDFELRMSRLSSRFCLLVPAHVSCTAG